MVCSANQDKINKFRAGLKLLASRGERPHFLHGTTELQNKKFPIALPPLQNSYFTQYDPRQGEGVSVLETNQIELMLESCGTRMFTVNIGYEGACNASGELHGYGRIVHSNGDIYCM